jgi:transposase
LNWCRPGRKPGELAKEFGCHASSILSWVRQLTASPGMTPDTAPLNSAERQELIELRRKFRQVQQERDILAKATAWFASNGAQTPTASSR